MSEREKTIAPLRDKAKITKQIVSDYADDILIGKEKWVRVEDAEATVADKVRLLREVLEKACEYEKEKEAEIKKLQSNVQCIKTRCPLHCSIKVEKRSLEGQVKKLRSELEKAREFSEADSDAVVELEGQIAEFFNNFPWEVCQIGGEECDNSKLVEYIEKWKKVFGEEAV